MCKHCPVMEMLFAEKQAEMRRGMLTKSDVTKEATRTVFEVLLALGALTGIVFGVVALLK